MAGPSEKYEIRRAARMQRHTIRVEWFAKRVEAGTVKTMGARLKMAGQLLRDRIVINLSRPVRKIRSGGRTRVDPTSRSKPGEFPRADTTRLMKDIFWKETEVDKEVAVGTTLDYGLFLETRMGRSFLVRTTKEMEPDLKRILGKPLAEDTILFQQHPEAAK